MFTTHLSITYHIYLNKSLFSFFLYVLPAEECHKFTDLNIAHSLIGTSTRVRLLLYTRINGTCGALISHTDLSASPQFNPSKPTTFIIHGFRITGSPPGWLDTLIELLLAKKDMNVIVVDWNYGAANLNYFKAVKNTQEVANNITAFIKTMQVWDGSDTVTVSAIFGYKCQNLLCLVRLTAGSFYFFRIMEPI